MPKYTIFASNPEKYLDLKTYLPPREMLKEDFVWTKPSSMPAQQLLAWAVHLYARQERRNQGENIEVLAFYVVDKQQRPHLTIEGDKQNEPTETPVGRQAHGSSTNTRPGIRADLSAEETVRAPPALEKNIVFEVGSPGAAGAYWKSKITFLKSLCKSPEYQKLVCWLHENQV